MTINHPHLNIRGLITKLVAATTLLIIFSAPVVYAQAPINLTPEQREQKFAQIQELEEKITARRAFVVDLVRSLPEIDDLIASYEDSGMAWYDWALSIGTLGVYYGAKAAFRAMGINDLQSIESKEELQDLKSRILNEQIPQATALIERWVTERDALRAQLGLAPAGSGGANANSKLIVPIPGVGGEETLRSTTDLNQYIRYIYLFGIVLASIFAVVSIVYAGIVITTSSGNAAKVANAKEIIQQSLLGIVLLLGAVIILNTINPNILKTKISPTTPSGETSAELDAIKSQIAGILNPLSGPRTITIVEGGPTSSTQIKTIADYEAVVNFANNIINILEPEIAGLENNPDPLDPDNEILDKKEEVLTAMKEAHTPFDINVIWDKYDDLLRELTALRSPATPQKLEAARDLLNRARKFRDFDLQTNYVSPASAIGFINRLEYLDGEFSVYIHAQSSERILLGSCQAERGRLFDEFVTSRGLVPEHYGDHYRYLGLMEPEKAPDGTEVWSLSQTTEGAAIATSLDQYIDDRLPTSCKRDESIYTFSQRCLLEEVESFESFLNSRGIAPDETVEYPSLNNTLIRIGAPHSGIRTAKTGAKSLEEISANLPTDWNNYWGPRKKSDCSAFYLDLTSTKYSSVLK